jgi:uncharacterized membrane protein YedE/YeeE
MFGFILFAVLFIIVGGLLCWASSESDFIIDNDLEFAATFIAVVLFLSAAIFLLIGLIRPMTTNRNIRDFVEFKYYVEEVYEFEEPSLCDYNDNADTLDKCVADLTLYDDILNYNMWLTESRAAEEAYGIFSFYDETVHDLEYIGLPPFGEVVEE